ncbi:MAG: tyrosine-type recombinase/integrase [Polynucleobacter sp.]|nr:tyrosine-type recombinase/integrase [Polynucleobacter sp.]
MNAIAVPSSATPWNKGKIVGQKPPLRLNEIYAIRIRLQLAHRTRDLALFNLAIDSKLRACDLVRLRAQDVTQAGQVQRRAVVMQRKTRRSVQFELSLQTRNSTLDWIRSSSPSASSFLFPSRMKQGGHLSTRQYARIVHGWIRDIGLDSSAYGSHSLRRTKAALIYRRTHNLRAVQLLLGHTKIESTVRYLGVELDDALDLAEQTES